MNNIKLLRRTAGMSQQELAKAVGVAQSRISAYESGKLDIDNMTIKLARKFATALNCTVEQLTETIFFDPEDALEITHNQDLADRKDLKDGNLSVDDIINNRFM